jgi:hypothetical protein
MVCLAGKGFSQDDRPKSGSPLANFYDNSLLSRAAADIANMSRHEIDLLTDALATCSVHALSADDSRRDLCRVADERYRIAYNANRPLDKILMALKLIYPLVLADDRLPQNDPRRKQVGKHLERVVDVEGLLATAVSARNRELATGSQR